MADQIIFFVSFIVLVYISIATVIFSLSINYMRKVLNAKNKVSATEILFEGTLTASSVYPREVIRAALDHDAAALIFAHNHPSGDPKPSREDVAVTRQLVFACKFMGITVHEHLIIGEDGYFSFADNGYLKQINNDFNQYDR